jgi:hypothetical protein
MARTAGFFGAGGWLGATFTLKVNFLNFEFTLN